MNPSIFPTTTDPSATGYNTYVPPTAPVSAPVLPGGVAADASYATQAAALAALGSQTGTPGLIASDNRMGQDGLLRPFDHNPAGRGAHYDAPNPLVNVEMINSTYANNAGYNQLMMEVAQHFDPMIQISTMTHPRWWHDRIPRTSYKLFDGASHETTIFRGGLYTYAGLKRWQSIASTPYGVGGSGVTGGPEGAVDPCAPLPFETVKYGWERLSWTGKRTAWGSDPICLDMFKYFTQATQQLAWILSVGSEEGIEIQEVWNRDMFIYQSVSFGRSFVMNDTFSGQNTSAKYWYNPFADPDAITEPSIRKAVGGKAYLLTPVDTPPTPLNFDVLDQVRESLKVRCPRAAVSNAGGDPIFALTVSHDDVERYIRGNEEERKYWIEADPKALIKGYDFAASTFRRWVITNDNNQIRFKIVGVMEVGDGDEGSKNTAAALLGDPTATRARVPAGQYYVAVAVDPIIASPTRIGVNGSPIPEDNPEYYKAELAIGCVFMNHVFTNQFVPDVTTLGSGTHFGPVTGLNGKWGWMNIVDRETNPLGNVGNFYGRFEIFPKPETHVVHTTSFLYRRCMTALPSVCPVDNTKLFNPSATSTTLAEDAVCSFGTAEFVLADPLKGAGIGTKLTVGSDQFVVIGVPGTRRLRVQLVSRLANDVSDSDSMSNEYSDADYAGAFTYAKGATVAVA